MPPAAARRYDDEDAPTERVPSQQSLSQGVRYSSVVREPAANDNTTDAQFAKHAYDDKLLQPTHKQLEAVTEARSALGMRNVRADKRTLEGANQNQTEAKRTKSFDIDPNPRPRDAAIRAATKTPSPASPTGYTNPAYPTTSDSFNRDVYANAGLSGQFSSTRNTEIDYRNDGEEDGNRRPNQKRGRRGRQLTPNGRVEDKRQKFDTVRKQKSFKSKEARGLLNELSEFSDEHTEAELPPPAKNPSFPILIFLMAATKDIIDALELSIIGMLLTKVLSLIIALVLFFWILGKMSGGWWKKRIIKWLWTRYAVTIVIEFIPLAGLIPMATIFVLMAHYREKKIVKLANMILEELHRGGFGRRSRSDD